MPFLRLRRRRIGPGAEVVTFFDEAHDPVPIREHVLEGIEKGEGILLLLKPFHWEWLRSELVAAQVPVDDLVESGRLVHIDAAVSLARMQKAKVVQETSFHAFIEPMWRQVSDNGRLRVRAVGDVIGLLWRRGEHEQAFALEAMWQRFLARHDVFLLLAYRIRSLRDVDHPIEPTVEREDGAAVQDHADRFDAAVAQALAEVVGPLSAARLGHLIRLDLALPRDLRMGERTLFWVRHHLPERSLTIMERARAHFRLQEA